MRIDALWDSDQAARGSWRIAVIFHEMESEGWCHCFGVLDTSLGLICFTRRKGVNASSQRAFTSVMQVKL